MRRPVGRRARRAVARALSLAGGRGRGLRILTYHRVNASHPRDRLSVHPDHFAAQLEALSRSGRPVVSLEAAVGALRGGTTLPAGAVALTFDDGFADNAQVAAPILARYGFPATFFLATGYVGTGATLERYGACCMDDRMLGWDEVARLRAAGHAIGGHGRTHRELDGLPEQEARAEIAGCARDVEAETGVRPRLFCYPRGAMGHSTRTLVTAAGFEAACTVRPGANGSAADLLALRRTEVSGDDDLDDFRLKLAGGFDGWHRLRQGAAAWGRTR